MVLIQLLGCIASSNVILGATAYAIAAADVPTTRFAESRLLKRALDPQISTFVESLAVPSPQAEAAQTSLNADPSVTAFLQTGEWIASALTKAACQSLRLILGDSKVDTTPVSPAVIQENWSQTCWKTPTCAVLAQNSKDVSVAIKTIKFLKLKFAVRSGGHSPNPGASSTGEPGILIDLQNLKQVSLSADKKAVSLGPGGRWGEVYAALDPSGLSVIGGRIPQVGVGGLILGGGFFHFSGQYGLAADNVKNFEVVLADGRIVNANSAQNSDLFWALKGGGPNFGIVTKFDVFTTPNKIWYTVSIYGVDQANACIDAFTQWQKTASSDLKSTVALIIGLDTITLGFLYSQPTVPSSAFAAFSNLPPPLVVAVPPTQGTVNSLTQILGASSSPEPLRHDYRGVSSGVDAQLYKDVYAIWKAKALAVRASTGANQTFVLQPIPAGLTAASTARGGNPMGIPQKNHQWFTTLIDWRNPADDTTVRSVSIATTDAWKKLSKERGLEVPFIFQNDASRTQNPIGSYGAANVQKLKTIAAKYDPTQVFQNLQVGGFLLKNV
ncbi:Glucooligosaccharide oxidase [Sporormia fimetaria CBS 119925]|uniref:Glucooligosaccharide oxidase n=1 Tax=Sporormia fimetaria CBS 119925 TaxID=1340428 RepID=A0A6A6V3G0_9PLEO|nr:Glucooligosaccharide oxidase [Sporormia fimetaria CBS 119925]